MECSSAYCSNIVRQTFFSNIEITRLRDVSLRHFSGSQKLRELNVKIVNETTRDLVHNSLQLFIKIHSLKWIEKTSEQQNLCQPAYRKNNTKPADSLCCKKCKKDQHGDRHYWVLDPIREVKTIIYISKAQGGIWTLHRDYKPALEIGGFEEVTHLKSQTFIKHIMS